MASQTSRLKRVWTGLLRGATLATAVAGLFAGSLVGGGGEVQAHNLQTRMTYMYLDKSTQACLDARIANTTLPPGCQSIGTWSPGVPVLAVNDEIGLVIKVIPDPAGTNTGVGGHVDFYVPNGVTVIDVANLMPDGLGGFTVAPMKGQSPIAIGDGPIGAKTTAELSALGSVTYTSPNGIATNPVTTAGTHRGTIAGVYGDTGIFYSTSPKTAWGSWQTFTGDLSAIGNCGSLSLNPSLAGQTITNNSGDVVVPCNKWDAEQLFAWGAKGTTYAGAALRGGSLAIVDYPDQRGNAPWGFANGVAGPQSGYAWEFDWDAYKTAGGNPLSAANIQAGMTTAKIGPWKRIQYPGSRMSYDQPGLISTTIGYANQDASTLGVLANTLPPTHPTTGQTDNTSPKTIRWAVGQLTRYRPEYVWVKIKINQLTNAFLDASGCPVLHSDSFGGDAGGSDNGKDHLWRYYEPSIFNWNGCLGAGKPANLEFAASNQVIQYKIKAYNLGTQSLTNVTITDTLPTGLTFLSAAPAQTSGPNPLVWNVGNWLPGQKFEAVITAKVTGAGQLSNCLVISGKDPSNNTVTQKTCDDTITTPTPYLIQTKSATPTSITPGASVTYTLTVNNIGSGATATPVTVTDILPTGFTYSSLASGSTVNGVPVTPTVGGTASQPVFTVASAINAGQSLVIKFNAATSASLAPGSYCNTYTVTQGGIPQSSGSLACVTVGGGQIGDTLFRDWNGNGTQDAGEEGMAGVTVTLTGTGGASCTTPCTAVTDANGNYLFSGLNPGNYTVTVPNPGSGGVPSGYTLTADPNGAPINASFSLTLAANEKRLDVDFGYKPGGLGSIGDQVFEDKNNDGVYNGTDVGISGVTVELYEDTNGNGVIDSGDLQIATTTTNGSGIYCFGPPACVGGGLDTTRTYLVKALDGPGSAVDSFFANPYQRSTASNPVMVTPAIFTAQHNVVTTADFGYYGQTPGSIGDQVFIDTDGDGVYDPGEPGIANITVWLYIDLDNDGDPDESELLATTATDGNGLYSFPDLGPARYLVVVDQNDTDIPTGYVPTFTEIDYSLAAGVNYTGADFPFRPLLPKTVNTATAANGATLTFTLKPSYPGSDLLESVRVMDPVPSNTTYGTSTPGAASTGAYVRIAAEQGADGVGTVDVTTSVSVMTVGGSVNVTAAVYNTTGGSVSGVVPELTVNGGTATCGSPTPASATIANNTNQNFVWACTLSEVAEYRFTANASNGTVDWPEAISASVLSIASGGSTSNIVTWNLGSNTAKIPNEQLISGSVAGLYALAGKNPAGDKKATSLFSAYSISGNAWSAKTNTPADVSKGGALTSNGSNRVYGLQGNGAQGFWEYNPATNAWDAKANTGTNVGEGGALQYLTVGGTNYVFALMGNDTQTFKRYNVGDNTWASMVNTPATIKKGGALTTDGTYIYAMRGNKTNTFWRCDATTDNTKGACSGGIGSWTGLTNVPANVGWGGALTKLGDYIYATTGDNTTKFYRYGPLSGTPTWTAMADTLGKVSDGGALTNDGTYIYALQGKTKTFWRYDVTANTWSPLASVTFASAVGQGGALTFLPASSPVTRLNDLAASSSLVTSGGGFQLRMTLTSTAAANNVAPTLNAPTATGGASGSCSLASASPQNIPANGSISFVWNCTATNAGAIGSLTYTGTATNGSVTFNSAQANSILVSPVLSFTSTIGTFPASCLIANTGIIADQSGALNTGGNGTETTGTACGATIGDLVWGDTDGSGTKNGSEVGLAGVQVYIDSNGNSQYDIGEPTATTDVNGLYHFYGLAANTYTVRTLASTYPAGYIPTTPTFVTQSVAANGTNNNFDFGLQPAGSGSIGDYVWLDTNKDGLQDPGEQPLPGIIVKLYRDLNGDGIIDASDPLIGTDTTDANGLYDFTGLPIGANSGSPVKYLVQVDETNSLVTLPYPYSGGPTTAGLGAAMDPTTGTTNPRSVSLYVGNANVTNADFGYNWSGTVGDTVFYDTNGNGTQDGGETGVPNVTLVIVWDQNGNGVADLGEPALKTAFTDVCPGANCGKYLFDGMPPSKYVVQVAGQTVESPTNPGVYGTMVPTATYGEDYAVTLPAGGSVLTADFGFLEAARVEGMVFWDQNFSGVPDSGEPGLGNGTTDVTVTLTGTDFNNNPVTKTFQTNSANGGEYFFMVPPGNYTVSYNTGQTTTLGYPAATTVTSYGITPLAGQEITDLDFGVDYSGSIGDRVWNDANGNGSQDSGELGIPGVTVQLYQSNGTTLITSVSTDSNGNYHFPGLADGTYVVKVLTSTLPGGYTATGEGDPGTACGGGCDNQITGIVVSGAAVTNVDFGYKPPGTTYSVSGIVWNDNGVGGGIANNGIKDGAEPGIGSVTVTLYRDLNTNGQYDPGEPVFGTTTTSESGAYSFPGVPNGNYAVRVDTNTLPSVSYSQSGDPDQPGVHCTLCDNQGAVVVNNANVTDKNFGYYNPVPTAVIVSDFRAVLDQGEVVLRWTTVMEARTLGFTLERGDSAEGPFDPVTQDLLPALIGSPQGGTYQLTDPSAETGKTYYYLLIEVDDRGMETAYGPYPVRAGVKGAAAARSGQGKAIRFKAEPTRSPKAHAKAEVAKAVRQIDASQAGLLGAATMPIAGAHIEVEPPGLYYLSSTDLAGALNMNTRTLEGLISKGNLKLTSGGQAVAYAAGTNGGGLYFAGESIDSIHTAANVYKLTKGKGNKMAEQSGKPPANGTVPASFRSRVSVAQHLFARPGIETDPEANFWHWECIQAPVFYPLAPCDTNEVPLEVGTPDAVATGTATVRVYLRGASDAVAGNDHQAVLSVGGAVISTLSWDGFNSATLVGTVNQSALTGGKLSLSLKGLNPPGSYSLFFIDRVEVEYGRAFRALNDELFFSTPAGAVKARVGGFSGQDIKVLEVTDPKHPRWLTKLSVVLAADGSYQVTFAPAAAGGRYLAVSGSGVRSPAVVTTDFISNLRALDNAAEYLVIAPSALRSAAQDLATYRSSDFSTLAIDLQDIYDEWNNGIANPNAIRNFLAHAKTLWSVGPEQAVLLGRGTIDPKDYTGYGNNLVPVLMTPTLWGLTGCDVCFGDTAGNDGVPEVVVGRVDAETLAEAQGYIAKVKAYEADLGPWSSQALTLADNADSGGNFPIDSAAVGALLNAGGLQVTPLVYSGNITATRTDLINAINGGVGFWNYIGHGAQTRLGAEGFVRNGDDYQGVNDVALLVNGSKLPVMAALTCLAGDSTVPQLESLAQSLAMKPDGGIVAALAPYGLSVNVHAMVINQRLVDALYGTAPVPTLGDAVWEALQAHAVQYGSNPTFDFMRKMYRIEGDPGLKVHLP